MTIYSTPVPALLEFMQLPALENKNAGRLNVAPGSVLAVASAADAFTFRLRWAKTLAEKSRNKNEQAL